MIFTVLQINYDVICAVFMGFRLIEPSISDGLRLRNEHPLRVNPVQFAYFPKIDKQCYGIVTGILSLVLM